MKGLISLALFLCLGMGCSTLVASECAELKKCIDHVSKLTGKKYFWEGSINSELQFSANFVLNAENADLLFTEILDTNSLARIPTGVADTYKIIRAADIRYQSLPNVKGNLTTEKIDLPASKDYYYFEYTFENNSQGQADFAANNIRPFLSRFGRAIANGRVLIVMEQAVKIPVALRIAKGLDRKLSKEVLNRARERDRKNKKKE